MDLAVELLLGFVDKALHVGSESRVITVTTLIAGLTPWIDRQRTFCTLQCSSLQY